jgi:hypothetical protein
VRRAHSCARGIRAHRPSPALSPWSSVRAVPGTHELHAGHTSAGADVVVPVLLDEIQPVVVADVQLLPQPLAVGDVTGVHGDEPLDVVRLVEPAAEDLGHESIGVATAHNRPGVTPLEVDLRSTRACSSAHRLLARQCAKRRPSSSDRSRCRILSRRAMAMPNATRRRPRARTPMSRHALPLTGPLGHAEEPPTRVEGPLDLLEARGACCVTAGQGVLDQPEQHDHENHNHQHRDDGTQHRRTSLHALRGRNCRMLPAWNGHKPDR